MTLEGANLKSAYAEMSEHIGADVALVRARGLLHFSVDNEVQMQMRERGRLAYVSATAVARQLRIEAPVLIEHARMGGGEVLVDLLPDRIGALPDAVRICPVHLVTLDLGTGERPPLGEAWTRATVSTVNGDLEYEFTGPFGLEDLTSVVHDAMMLSEPVDEIACEGAHGIPYSEPGDISPDAVTAQRVLALRNALCQECLDTMARTGFPLSPYTPQEWE